MNPDFGATAADYAAHRAGFPDSLFARLAASGVGQPGQSLVDLGTGTGTLARGFARRGCRVVGVDRDRRMLAQARQLDRAAGAACAYVVGRAEATGLADAVADAVTAGQCWHWFDRRAAGAEVARLLRPDGRVAIAHFDWIPLPGNVVEATEQLIEAHNPAWRFGGGNGIYGWWLRGLGKAGFRDLTSFSYDTTVPYTSEAWRGRIRASAGVGAALAAAEVAAFDAALVGLLAARFPDPVLAVPHRVFAVIGTRPAPTAP
jgi:SAM-dependent methyltransferase